MKDASKIYKVKLKSEVLSVMIDSAYTPENIYKKELYEPNINGKHSHAWYELFIIGDEPLILNYEEKEIKYQNCVLVVPPFVEHYAIRSSDFRIMVSYKQNDDRGLFNSEEPYCILVSYEVVTYANTIKRHYFEMGSYSEEIIEALLKLIFCLIFSIDEGKTKGTKRVGESYLAKIENILFDYWKDINLGFVAKELRLSTKQVSRIIRKSYNTTLSEMLTKKRLDVASALLINSDLKISEIAERVNFSSESYFYSQFKKAYGLTPLKYKKLHKRKSS